VPLEPVLTVPLVRPLRTTCGTQAYFRAARAACKLGQWEQCQDLCARGRRHLGGGKDEFEAVEKVGGFPRGIMHAGCQSVPLGLKGGGSPFPQACVGGKRGQRGWWKHKGGSATCRRFCQQAHVPCVQAGCCTPAAAQQRQTGGERM